MLKMTATSEAIKAVGIPNEIKFFNGGEEMLEYLNNTEEQPFIILSDINMPGMTGLQLKKLIQEDPYLVSKGVPFVFISTNASKASVHHAHALSAQGYFEKPNNVEEIKEMFSVLFLYWERCKPLTIRKTQRMKIPLSCGRSLYSIWHQFARRTLYNLHFSTCHFSDC